MKKFKKNFSKTVFASFFVFQFVVSTSFMPLIANAEDVSADPEASSVEEVSDVSKEEIEESISSEVVEETITEEIVVSDESTVEESSTPSEPSLENRVMGQFVDGNLRVCKVILDAESNIVSDPASRFPGVSFRVPITSPNFANDAIFNTDDFELNTTFGVDESAFDAMCQTLVVPIEISDIASLSDYSYGEEEVEGAYTWVSAYNDGDFNTLSAFAYGDVAESDGEILFTGNTESGFAATLLVVNRLTGSACDAPAVYARINLENLEGSLIKKTNGGLYNTGTGNMAPKVFVGGTTDSPNELGGDVYDIDEWFPVYDSVNGYINDPILTSTDPGVPGLMVERLNGQVRVVLYGSHSQPAGAPETNREMANGFVEFSNDRSTISSDVEIVGQVVDLQNPPEMNPTAPLDGPNNDYISFTSQKSNFKFVVTTHNDGMYTLYTHTLPPSNCGGGDENQPPVVNAPAKACILKTDTSYDFLDGVTAFDPEDGTLTPGYIAEEIRFGVVSGPYTIWYAATDSEGLVAGATTLLSIEEKCDDNGGGKNEPPILKVIPNTDCIATTATSFDFLNGVTAVDPEDGIIVPTYTHNIVFGTPGMYTIYYKATDSDLLSTLKNRTLYINDECVDDDGIVETISVCKIIAKNVNGELEVVDGSDVPGYTFTIPWVAAPVTPGMDEFEPQPVIEDDAVFTTDAFVPNRKILSSSTGNDAMCISFTDLTLGSYFYGEETITGGDGSIEWTTKYSDQVLRPVNDFGDVFDYDDGLFTVGFGGGSTDYNGDTINTNADGHVLLIKSRKVRTIVVINVFEDDKNPPKACETTQNLISNGSFESPEVTHPTGWDIYGNGTVGLEWSVAWNGINPNAFPKAELQENVGGWDAHSGNQYIELDSDHNGHVGNLNGEPASTKISQVIDTVPGQFYQVNYEFAARPGTPASDNRLGFYVDGVLYDDVSASGLAQNQIAWQTRIFAFYATGTQTTISFADLGDPDSYGTFLDSVEVICVDDEDPVNTPPKIKVKDMDVFLPLTATSYNFFAGVSAEDAEDGNLTSSIIISSNNVVFGTAGVYTVTYSVTDSDGATSTESRTIYIKKNCDGTGDGENPTILFSPQSCILVGTTNYNFMTGVFVSDDEGAGNVTVTNNGSTVVNFNQAGSYAVTYIATDSDGNTATETINIVVSTNCGGNGGDEDPVLTVPGQACLLTGVTSFDFMSGVSATDDEGADNVTITNNGSTVVAFGSNGTYTVTYTATDSDGNTDVETRTIVISTNCNGGGGDDEDPTITFGGQSCILTSVTSFDFNAGVTVTDDEGAGNVTVTNNSATAVTFGTAGTYVVTYTATDSDGNVTTATRTFTISSDCGTGGGDNNPPTITITGNSCIETSATSFDFLAGVTAIDDLDGTITLNLTDNVLGEETVIFGTVGTYTVTYTVTDSLLETTTTTRTITISTDCDNGGGGNDDDPTITFGGQACILTSSTSFDFMSGVTVGDDEGADNVTITNNGATVVTFGTAGTYTVTYTATDSDGNVTQVTRTITISTDCDNGGGGGGDNDPTLSVPSDSCIETSVTSFDFMSGVSATDDEGADNVTITNNGSIVVAFGSNGTYTVTYTATDSDGNTDTVTRTITISEDCDNGGGGGGDGGGGGGNGGGSSSGSRGGNRGEVLGATSCVAFTTYNRLGNSGGEIKALQTFLNEYMDAGLTVDGVYGKTTVQAVHDFQAFHWSEVIDPWTPPLSPNTTGWEYKTTRMTINAIIDCPEAPVYLEDPGVMYQVIEVKDQKSFTTKQKEAIYNLLRDAQSGNVLGASDVNTNTTNILDPNYDLMYGK